MIKIEFNFYDCAADEKAWKQLRLTLNFWLENQRVQSFCFSGKEMTNAIGHWTT